MRVKTTIKLERERKCELEERYKETLRQKKSEDSYKRKASLTGSCSF
jgi:hypothetical protein